MIPKIIHYCWFGKKPKSDLANQCINSWKKFCPNYEIIEWNEDNFDLDKYVYVREAYDNGKWAFVTDVVRLYVLHEYGGIYMDTDVEVLRPLDCILKYKAISGFQTEHDIPTGLIAAEKGHKLIEQLLSDYENQHFVLSNGMLDLTTNVSRITEHLLRCGLVQNNQEQTFCDFTLLPMDYFCAKDFITGRLVITENTLTIHHFAGSWFDKRDRVRGKLVQLCYRILGTKVSDALRKVFGIKK